MRRDDQGSARAPQGERLDAVERRIENLSTEVTDLVRVVTTGGAVTAKLNGDEIDKLRDAGNLDEVFACPKCRRYLGLYDVAKDTLRLKRATHLVFVRLGVGGQLEVHCWGCGDRIVLDYTLPRSPEQRVAVLGETLASAVVGLLGSDDPDTVGPVLQAVSDVIRDAAERVR